jgi:SAM-dependent methyltransferase
MTATAPVRINGVAPELIPNLPMGTRARLVYGATAGRFRKSCIGACWYPGVVPRGDTAARREAERARHLFNRAAPLFLFIERWLEPQYRAALAALGLPSHLTVLDVGTGTGSLAVALAARGHPVTGIDVAERLLRRARRRVPAAAFHRMDLAELPDVAAGAFDLVAVGYVLHGLPPRLRRFTVEQAGRIAARAVLIFDYARSGPWFVRLVEHFEGPHYREFLRTSVEDLLEGVGLTVERTVPVAPSSACWLGSRSLGVGS